MYTVFEKFEKKFLIPLGIGALLVCFFLLFFYVQEREGINKGRGITDPYLVVSHNDMTKNGGPLTLINLRTYEEVRPQVPAIGCGGVTLDTQVSYPSLTTYCVDSEKGGNLWDIDLRDFSVKEHVQLPHPFENNGVRGHAHVLTDRDGWQYFNDGGPIFTEQGYINESGVVISKGEEAYKVFISDRIEPYFILKMVLDEEAQKLWVMSMGDEVSVLIDRIDLTTRTVDFSHTTQSHSGHDMVVNGVDVLVSTFRTKDGADVTVFDKVSGAVRTTISISGENLGFNALSLLVRGSNLYVSQIGGLQVYDAKTYALKEFIANNPESQFTTLVNDADTIYAIDSYDRVLEIPDTDMLHPRLLLDGTEQGLTNLFLVHKEEYTNY